MVSGREFSGEMALRYGLVHHLSGSEGLEAATDDRVKELLRNGPEAMSGVKSLLNRLGSHPDGEEIMELTAELIARHRTSSEGQEGMRAFFEKRKPNWE
jgi:methylglutaconyl-CoA hydratase